MEQHGIVAVAQLRALGLDKYRVRRYVANGRLHRVHQGVYSVGISMLSVRGKYLAAVLACGPGAVLSHRAAADVWRLRPNAAGRLEVTVPRHRDGPSNVEVHRSRSLRSQDITIKHGIPVTTVARTLLDLSAILGAADLEVAVDRAERLGLFDLTAVVDVLERARGRRGSGKLRRTVQAYEISTQKSNLERRFKAILETAADIPSPFFNAMVDGEAGTHEVDAHWPAYSLAVQVDGFEFHRTRRDRENDAASDADLELGGQRVMRFTWDDVTVHASRTLRRIRLALAEQVRA